MVKIAIVSAVYATILIIGGLIGYIEAHSHISLLASSVSATLMLFAGFLMNKGNPKGFFLSLFTSGFLALFFTYRYLITFKFMPAGLMAILSILFIVYAVFTKKNEF